MTKWLEEIKGTNTPLETNGVFEVEKEDTRKWVEDTLKIWKIIIREEEIESILKENRVTQRITLLRHYPYNEEAEEYKRYLYLLNKKRKWWINKEENDELKMISEETDKKVYWEIEQIPEWKYISSKYIELLFKDTEKLKLAYYTWDNWMQRCKITWESFKRKYKIREIENVDLVWWDKWLDIWEIYLKTPWELRDQINKLLKWNKCENIVIISNRSYAHWFNLYLWDRYISVDDSIKIFEENNYIFIDLNEKQERVEKKMEVNLLNYLELSKIFNIEHTSIIDFQNKLNVYFIKNPELIKIYVKSEIEELRKYCLFKLIENKELETLNEIFRDEKIRKEIKLEDYEKWDIRVYNILRYYTEVYPELLTLRNKSLDERINSWEDINPDFNFDKSEYNELLELIRKGKTIKYIEWKAWAWKSFLLSHIAEKLNEENLNNNWDLPFYINFLSLTWIKDFKEIKFKAWYENILLIDSIDESSIYWEEIKN